MSYTSLKLPPPTKPAAELTDAERFAVACLAGCPLDTVANEQGVRIAIRGLVGITDRPGGGYFVAHSESRSASEPDARRCRRD